MRVIVNPHVYAASGGRANVYHNRRLVYQAEILRRANYDVAIHPAGLIPHSQDIDARRMMAALPVVDDITVRNLGADDIYICSVGYILVHKEDSLPPKARIIAWADSLSCFRGYDMDRVDLFMSWTCGPEEFTEQTEKAHPGIAGWRFPDKARVLSVPFVPHDLMLEQFWRDGMTDAFLDDDMEAIRDKYSHKSKLGRVGFIGGGWPIRTKILPTLDGIYVYLTNSPDRRLSPVDMLREISQCEAIMQLPGDTWKCARHMEAVLLGRPVVQKRGVIDVTPPLTDSNTILVDEWSDMDAVRSRLPGAAAIVAEADKCYKDGWSLRGQILTAIKMVTK